MSNRPKLSQLAYMLGLYSNKTIPQTYIMEMSNYELLLSIMDKVNELVERNQTFTDVINELIEYLNTLDDNVVEEVEKYLQKMSDDGVFDDIVSGLIDDKIETLLLKALSDKSGGIDLSHMGYILHNAHSYGVNELPSAPLTVDEELYSALQGNCVFEINGNMYWACCYVCQNGSDNDRNNGVRIYVYTVNQDGSLSYVTDKEYVACGHCNAMTFFNGYLYITPNSYASNDNATGGYTTDILRVSFDGENLGGTDVGSHKYAVERKTPTGWAYVTDLFSDFICAFDGQLYVCDGHMNVYTYDWDTNEVTLVYNEINGIEGYTGDGFSMDSKFIYMGSRGYRIKRYNKELGYVDWVIQLPVTCNNKMYKLGEVEGFTVIDDVIYIAGFYNLNGDSTSVNTYSVTRFYRQNLYKNNIPMTNNLSWANGSLIQSISTFVSGNLPSDTDGSRNELGLTQATAFPCVQIALDFLESCYWLNRMNIVVYQYRNLSTIDIRTTKNVILSGSAFKNAHSGTKPSVGYIHVPSNSNVQLNDLNISNILPSSLNKNYGINAEGCKISLENIAFPAGFTTNLSNVLYGINVSRSVMNYYRNDDSTTEETWANRGDNYKLVNAFNSTINGHGLLATNVNVIA